MFYTFTFMPSFKTASGEYLKWVDEWMSPNNPFTNSVWFQNVMDIAPIERPQTPPLMEIPFVPPQELVEMDEMLEQQSSPIMVSEVDENHEASSVRSAAEDTPVAKKPRLSRTTQKRPRVPKEQQIKITVADHTTLANMRLPRSKKITPVANKENLAAIHHMENILIQHSLLDECLKHREEMPKKTVFELDSQFKKIENDLNRKATDHYNKRRFAWNEREVSRLREYLTHNHIDFS
jgi:hypothetical protein